MRHFSRLLFFVCILVSARARETVALGDWAKVTVPESYQRNEPFTVEVEILKLDAPTQLALSANWTNENGHFGGFLQYLGAGKPISAPGTTEFRITINKTKPNLKGLMLSVFLSPDGNWKNNTVNGGVNIPLREAEESRPEPAPRPVNPQPVRPSTETDTSAFQPLYRPPAPSTAAVPILPTDPPSMQVKVSGGSVEMPNGRRIQVRPATLSFAPPEIERFKAEGKKGNPAPAPVNFADYHNHWDPWPGALGLTPKFDRRNTLILGSLYRHWRPETLSVKDAGGTVKVRDRDFVFNEDWGLVLNLNGGLGEPKTGRMDISIEAALPRIDLIQVNSTGQVAVKQGETRLVCPPRPVADSGWIELATVYVAPWRTARNPHYDADPSAVEGATEYAVTATEIFPIHEPEAVTPVNAKALSKTGAKLAAGQPVTIAFMGDSIMVGAEATAWYVDTRAYTSKDRTARGSFIYQLRRRFSKAEIEPVHAFKGGETIQYAVKVYDELVASKNVDMVVLAFGANDMDSSIQGPPKNSPEEFKAAVGKVVDRAKTEGVEVMLVTPLPRNPWFKNGLVTRQLEYHRVLHELAQEKNAALAPVFRMFQQLPARGIPVYNTLHNWNNHPGDLGHGIYAEAMLNTLQAAVPSN